MDHLLGVMNIISNSSLSWSSALFSLSLSVHGLLCWQTLYVSDGVVLPSVYHGGASVFVTAYMGNKNRIANRVSTKLLILITDSLLGTPSRVLVQKYLLCILISKDEQKWKIKDPSLQYFFLSYLLSGLVQLDKLTAPSFLYSDL